MGAEDQMYITIQSNEILNKTTQINRGLIWSWERSYFC